MKKITYLVASLMLMGTTPMLTGCVDIDEPAGIEELRGAKAELLTAKAAVEKAKVATEEANAAYRQAEAEYVKAQAAREKAAAAVEEAKAKQIEAETEIAKAEAENKIALANAKSAIEKAQAEQALAEARANAEQKALAAEIARAQAQQELDEAKASAERSAKEWELSYQKAQAEYQNYLVTLAIAKSNAIDAALGSYKTAVADAKEALDAKAEALRKAQVGLSDATSAYEESEELRDYRTRSLQKAVITKTNELEAAQVALDAAKEAYADAQTIEASELETKRDEQQAKVNAQIKKVADLNVAALEYEKLYEPEVTAFWNAYKAAYTARVEVPALSLDGCTYGDVDFSKLISKASSYKLHAADPEEPTTRSATGVTASENVYENRKADLEKAITIYGSYLGTGGENAVKWTKEEIAVLQNDIDEQQKLYDESYNVWQELVSAYATGKYNEADPTKITGYDELKEALDDYNAQVKTIQNIYTEAEKYEKKLADADSIWKPAEVISLMHWLLCKQIRKLWKLPRKQSRPLQRYWKVSSQKLIQLS